MFVIDVHFGAVLSPYSAVTGIPKFVTCRRKLILKCCIIFWFQLKRAT